MAIWVIKDGQREGPYEEQDVRELVYEGTYTDSEPAIRDGQYDWTTLGQILHRPQPVQEPGAAAVLEAPSLPPASESPPMIPEETPPIPDEGAPAEFHLPEAAAEPIPVSVVDFNMPFGAMVMFMVKWVLASIPALLILGMIATVLWTMALVVIAVAMRH
jgi:hypothetical protein